MFLLVFENHLLHLRGKPDGIIHAFTAVDPDPGVEILRPLPQDLQGLLLLVPGQKEQDGESGALGELLPEGLDDAVGMVPLLLVGRHEAAQHVAVDPRLGEDEFGRAVDLGGRRVSARIGEVGHPEPLLVEAVDAEHGAAAAHAVITDRPEHLTLDLVVHLGEIAGSAQVLLLHPPGDLVELRGERCPTRGPPRSPARDGG